MKRYLTIISAHLNIISHRYIEEKNSTAYRRDAFVVPNAWRSITIKGLSKVTIGDI